MDYCSTAIIVIILMEATFLTIQGKVRDVNMCRRNIMIRKDILLYHNIADLDRQLEDVTCQCDLYTPPYKGCVILKAHSVDTLTLLEPCRVQKGHSFNTENSSCIIQYRVNEEYENCTHNITVLIVADKVLDQPFKQWLYISASDRSGVYVNCKWTGSLTTVTYEIDTTEDTTAVTTSAVITDFMTEQILTNTTCFNCTTPPVRHKRQIRPSEVADQIDIIIATASGFVLAFLVIAYICICKSSRHRGKLEVTPVKPRETVAQLVVTTDVPPQSTAVYDSVFVETCYAEIKRNGSGSYTEPASNETDDENSNKYGQIVRRSSDDCYDNVAFES